MKTKTVLIKIEISGENSEELAQSAQKICELSNARAPISIPNTGVVMRKYTPVNRLLTRLLVYFFGV